MDCGCEANADSLAQRRVLSIALGLNATMFVVGLLAGLAAQSTGLIADSLDMFADATAYGIALIASRRGPRFKARAATWSGLMLLVLGSGVLCDVVRRYATGSAPESRIMMAVASLSLAVNATVLDLLGKHRDEGVHLRATWIFTRADVVANLAVIASGLTILLTGFRLADLIIGAAIGLYVIREALEILRGARRATEEPVIAPRVD
ncbi:MAG: cation transporter [Silvibacterium sp.]|nr:cation transporter [Silvibacterium sp.]